MAVAGAGTGIDPVSRPDPAAADRHRSVVNALDAETLEPLDPADDVHQRVHRADLMQRDLRRRHAVDPPLGLAQESERADRRARVPTR